MTDQVLCQKYINKIASSAKKDQEFSLSIGQFKKIMSRKTCYYTKVILTYSNSPQPLATDITIDRIDRKRGYVLGNCVACCHAFNQLKGVAESPSLGLSLSEVVKGMIVFQKLM